MSNDLKGIAEKLNIITRTGQITMVLFMHQIPIDMITIYSLKLLAHQLTCVLDRVPNGDVSGLSNDEFNKIMIEIGKSTKMEMDFILADKR